MRTLQNWLDESRANALQRFAPGFLLAVGLLLLIPGNREIPLIDRDEPRFAQATREMIQRHEWIVPYFNQEYRFDKPILIYWMMRASYAVFGVNEFSARLPSVASAILVALGLYYVGRRWFSAPAGFLAGFGWLTCLQVLMHGRSAVADMPMIAAVLGTQFAVFELLRGGHTPRRTAGLWGLLYGGLGLGFLAKGPVALVVPLLTLLLHRFVFWRRPLAWRRLHLAPGLLLTLAIMAAWGLPALARTHGLFWSAGMRTHVWERGLETFQGHGAFFLYYLATALFSLFPWIAFAGDGVAVVRRNWNEANAFLVAWLLGTYVLFSFYMTKLPHYVMPAFPAFFLLLGQVFRPDFAPPRAARWWFRAVIGVFTLAAILAWVLLRFIPFHPDYLGLKLAVRAGSILALALTTLALLWRAGRPQATALPLAIAALAIIVLGAGLRLVNPAIRFIRHFQSLPAAAACAFDHHLAEPSFVFYTNRRWERLAEPAEFNAFLAQPGPRVLVFATREVKLEKALLAVLRRWHGLPENLVARDYTDRLRELKLNGYQAVPLTGVNIARTAGVEFTVYYRE